MFGRSPLLGRVFTPDENQCGEKVVVLREGLWARRFHSAPDAIGRDLGIGGAQWKVIGVMLADFQVPFLETRLAVAGISAGAIAAAWIPRLLPACFTRPVQTIR